MAVNGPVSQLTVLDSALPSLTASAAGSVPHERGCLVEPAPTNSASVADCAVRTGIGLSALLDCWAGVYASFVTHGLAFAARYVEHRQHPESVRQGRFSLTNTELFRSSGTDPSRISAGQIRVRKSAGIWQRPRAATGVDRAKAGVAVVFLVQPVGWVELSNATENPNPTYRAAVAPQAVAKVSVTAS